MVHRWRLEDPYLPDGDPDKVYVFPYNPNDMTSPFGQRAISSTATTALTGQALFFEGQMKPVEWSFSGDILDATHYEKLRHWVYDKKRRLNLYDHFGRKIVLQLTKFDVKPKRAVNRYWRHTYEISALVISVGPSNSNYDYAQYETPIPAPSPTNPTPVIPTADPEPANPTPVDPTPVDPTPVDPNPTPVDPTPVSGPADGGTLLDVVDGYAFNSTWRNEPDGATFTPASGPPGFDGNPVVAWQRSSAGDVSFQFHVALGAESASSTQGFGLVMAYSELDFVTIQFRTWGLGLNSAIVIESGNAVMGTIPVTNVPRAGTFGFRYTYSTLTLEIFIDGRLAGSSRDYNIYPGPAIGLLAYSGYERFTDIRNIDPEPNAGGGGGAG